MPFIFIFAKELLYFIYIMCLILKIVDFLHNTTSISSVVDQQ